MFLRIPKTHLHVPPYGAYSTEVIIFIKYYPQCNLN